jgi:hypothetical protein
MSSLPLGVLAVDDYLDWEVFDSLEPLSEGILVEFA